MSAARTERLLNLLTLLLNSRRPISLREIREMDEFAAYSTSDPKSGERAFERDKASLVEAGIPLKWYSPEELDDEEGVGGYVIDRNEYYLPELKLDASDLALLSIAGAAAAAIDGFPGRSAVLRALGKLGFDTGSDQRPTAIAHAPMRADVDAKLVGRNLEILHGAIARRCQVDLSYQNRKGEATTRRIDPYGLYYRQALWYLVGYCHLRQEERTFHLGRVARIEIAKGQRGSGYFEVPEGFSVSESARRRPWEYPQHDPIQVRIQLAARLVPAIPELFGSQVKVVEKDESSALIELEVWNRGALIEAVLPFGAAAQVCEPADLRASIGEIYKSLAQRYTDVGGQA